MAKFVDTVDLSQISDSIKNELEKWNEEVYIACVETCEEGIKEAKKEIVENLDTLQRGVKDKETGSKHYRSTFTTRKKGDTKRVLWNRKYPLSHLLENGHYVYNQYGGPYEIKHSRYNTTGKKVTKAFGVWDKTEQHTSEYVEELLKKKLK